MGLSVCVCVVICCVLCLGLSSKMDSKTGFCVGSVSSDLRCLYVFMDN